MWKALFGRLLRQLAFRWDADCRATQLPLEELLLPVPRSKPQVAEHGQIARDRGATGNPV